MPFARPVYYAEEKAVACECQTDIDCALGTTCTEGACGGKGLCSINGCECEQDSDCDHGSLCNGRGFCTEVTLRVEGFCRMTLEKLAQTHPRMAVMQGWKKVEYALVNKIPPVRGVSFEDYLDKIAEEQRFSEQVIDVIKVLYQWNIVAQKGVDDKKFTPESASAYVLRVRKLMTIIEGKTPSRAKNRR